MNNVLILLDNLDDWKPYYETSSVLTVSDYLKNKPVEKDRKLVINLSDDYSYNSEGYYCSLLAQTRGQRVIPDVDIINKMEVGTGVRMDRSLQALCYQWIQKNDIKDDIWYLNIYFGKCREKGLERIARFIFENYPCPLLRVALNTHPRNQIEEGGGNYVLSITPQNLKFPANGDSQNVIVASNGQWSLSGGDSWCTPTITSGGNGANVTFSVQKNIELHPRFVRLCDFIFERDVCIDLDCNLLSVHSRRNSLQ